MHRVYGDEPFEGFPLFKVTWLELSWKAAKTPALFPFMRAKLSASLVDADETQIVMEGQYQPPLGLFGAPVDAALGHRVAEAALHSFSDDLFVHISRAPA
jgi:hypothetical protein